MAGFFWLTEVPEGLHCAVVASPKSALNRIEGEFIDTDGKTYLKVKITAAPEHGKANKALIKFLAKEWRVPASAFSVLRGDASRRKTLLVTGDPASLKRTILSHMEQK